MAWRLAYSLDTLRNQVNAAYPNRSKLSDGTIGDSAHAATASDHNPNSAGVVCALDLTHHAGYFDAHALADRLIVNRHPNLKYVISNRRIAGDWTGWRWASYSGSNPHDKHIHVSVGVGTDGKSAPGTYDNTTAWNITGTTTAPKGGDMTPNFIKATYKAIAGVEPPQEAINWHMANSTPESFVHGFWINNDILWQKLDGQLASVKQALANEQAKPPREVVKEVEKVVEKEVVKEVTVYTHDQATAETVQKSYKLLLSIKGMVANLFKRF